MRDLLFPIQESHLIDSRQVGGESSMHAQDVAVDDGSEGKIVEGFVKVFPTIRITVFPVNLVEEAVHHSYIAAFMISPQQVDPLRIFNFEAEK